MTVSGELTHPPVEVRRRRTRTMVLALVGTLLGALAISLLTLFRADAAPIPVVSPVYVVEAESNGHKVLLNLDIGQPGVPQVPAPVDVDGDLLPDILVAVNLVDASGAVHNPPQPGAILAPNVEITRDPSAIARCLPLRPLDDKCSPPLKVQVKLTIKDLNNLEKDKVVAFGYDTGDNGAVPGCATAPCPDHRGRIGSIPPYFKAKLGGLDQFFNPLTAEVSTKGFAILGQATNDVDIARLSQGYAGPLDLVASIGEADGITSTESGLLRRLLNLLDPREDVATDLRFGYRPWPGDVKVSFGSDDAGNHVTYEHERLDEVDLDTRIATFDRDGDVADAGVIEARVDRLPRRLALDFATGNRAGTARYQAKADGRLPDVHVNVLSEKLRILTKTQAEVDVDLKAKLEARLAGIDVAVDARLFLGLGEEDVDVALVPIDAPLFVDADIEALPAVIGADWSLPKDGPVHALFCSGPMSGRGADATCDAVGNGIGAIDAAVRNYYGQPKKLAPFVPEQQQVLAYDSAPGGTFGLENRIGGRADKVRQLSFAKNDAGFDTKAKIGDGELPLQVHFATDDRTLVPDGTLIDADATVTPLPADLTASLRKAGKDERQDPLLLTYTASESVDIDSELRLAKAGTPEAPECGKRDVVCGELKARHVPASITTRVGKFDTAVEDLGAPDKKFGELRVEIESVARQGGSRPDFFADVTAGGEKDIPLVAHAELLGFPEHVGIRAREGRDETLDRVEFHACKLLFDANPAKCADDTEGEIKSLAFTARNWLTRPADLPVLAPPADRHATLAVRGRAGTPDVTFEGTGRVTDVARLVYRNSNDILGVSSKIGGGHPLSALVDIGNVDLADDEPSAGRLDAVGEVAIDHLPATLDFCLRNPGRTPRQLSDEFTDPCEELKPFAELGDVDPITITPMSFGYDGGPTKFNAVAKAAIVQRGLSPQRADDKNLKAALTVENLPAKMTLHVEPPRDDRKRIRGVFGSDPGPGINADFAVESTDGDLVCQDPRTPALDKKAMCAQGRIENLPTKAKFRYDPNVRTDNLLVDTNSQIDLKNVVLSSVEGVRKSDDPASPDHNVVVPKVLVAEGRLTGLPKTVTGTLDLPADTTQAPTVELTAEPPIGKVELTVRNFIAPDPFLADVPTRAVDDFGTPTQTAFFRQRGALFKAEANLRDVHGAGFRMVKGASGKALDTAVVNVDFGKDQVIRAYADIQPDQNQHTIADVTLNDVPAGLSFCFRGKKKATEAPADGQATYCDTGDATIPVGDDDGSFQFLGNPDSPDASPLDVDAFVRHATGGGSSVLSGRLRVDNIPFVVKGTFPSAADKGTLDVGGFKRSGDTLVPDGIDRIQANIANFDLDRADTGYGDHPPFRDFPNKSRPFPVTGSPNQHLKAALKDGDFQVRGRIGPESQLQRVRMDNTKACAAPSENPADYPFYPQDGSKYRCIQAVFDPSAPNDVLDLAAHYEQQGNVVSLTDAGLTDVPQKIQLTLAETALLNADGTLRRRCGATNAEPAGTTNCMAPLLRFDQPSNAKLFGTARYGRIGDLIALDATGPGAITPREALADLDQAPTAAEFPGWGADSTGVRAKVVGFEGGRTAIKAGLRLAIPQSLTVDQIQSWSMSRKEGQKEYWEASDMRFHYVVRDSAGNPVGSLGQLAAMKHSEDGTQILLSSPCGTALRDQPSSADCADFRNGIPIPGEFGVDLYQRNHTGEGKDFIQVDGRAGNPGGPMNLGVRVLGGGPKPAVGRLEGEVRNVPTVGPDVAPNDPSFRLRVEMLGEGEAPPTGPVTPKPPSGEEKNCSPLLCVLSEARVQSVLASFDFLTSRRVEAVVRQAGATKQGMEIKAFDAIRAGNPSPISANAALDVNPINVFIHAGIPVIGGFDFSLASQLQAGFTLDRSTHFTLRHNTLHVKASNEAVPGAGSSTVGPIDYYVYHMHGSAYALFVKLFGIDFFPPSAPPGFPGPGPVNIKFLNCSFPGFLDILPAPPPPLSDNEIDVAPGGDRNVVLWPFRDDLRIHTSGVLKPVVDLARVFAAPFFCLSGADAGDIPLFQENVPGDPVGLERTGNHVVPDAPLDASPVFTPPTSPDVSPPDYTVNGTLALCGSHVFGNLTVQGTLTVATTTSTTDSTGTGADCPESERGRLDITAANMVVNGHVNGDHIITTTQTEEQNPPTDNGGAGHAGTGGTGSHGDGGGEFGDAGADPVTEPGARGGGPNGGNGGGAITIHAEDLTVTGQITARGASGGSGSADCDAPGRGSGGGSGGGIVITATRLTNNGTINADGGAGGAGATGGGGGGGAGRVKIVSPLLTGNAATATGGAPGAGLCGSAAGGGGEAFGVVPNSAPQSFVTLPENEQFWQRDPAGADSLDVPAVAAVAGGDTRGMQVFLCGVHRTSQQVKDAQNSGTPPDDLNSIFPMPTFGPGLVSLPNPNPGTQTTVAPCGTDTPFFATHAPLGARTFTGADRVDDTIPTPGKLGNGYWGVWTVVMRPPSAGESCLSPLVFPTCTVEVNPPRPDLVVGVDNAQPFLQIHQPAPNADPAPDFVTNKPRIKLVLEASDQVEFSGLAKVECSNDNVNFATCANGENDWPLAPGPDGPRTVHVKATDVSGNVSEVSVTGLLDTTVADADAAFSGGVQGGDEWYRVPPSVTLTGSDAGSGLADPAFAFRFDSGEELTCAGGSPCTLPAATVDALVTGDHTLHYTAIDQAGNRLVDDDPATPGPMKTKPVKIDRDRPISAFVTVPGGVDGATPTGANGWFTSRPFATFSGVDQPGGSGLEGGDAGVFYQVNGGSFTRYDNVPFRLAPGENTVCWFARDLAGNVEPTRCRGPIKVDDAVPTVAIQTNPATPTGEAGWHVTKPVVTVVGADSSPGSGVEGVFVSVDGGKYAPYTGPITIGEGPHEVRAYTVDVSGQRSLIKAASYLVDLSKPVSAGRLIPPDAAAGQWWRVVPRVVLRATDGERNSGVEELRYFLDGAGPFPYTGPFAVPSGVHTVTYQAIDRSGIVEPLRSLQVPVDIGPPVVRATAADRLIWLRPPLGPSQIPLKWTVRDDLSGQVRATVVVYNALGQPVRRITEAAPRTITPGAGPQEFATQWDGKDESLLGLVPVGVYYYRVVVTDEAGNISQSGESTPITIKVGLL